MNPFKPIFVVLCILITINHLVGNTVPLLISAISLVLFIKEYLSWSRIVSAEPDFMEGITNRIFFGMFRPVMFVAEVLALLAFVQTVVSTFGMFGK